MARHAKEHSKRFCLQCEGEIFRPRYGEKRRLQTGYWYRRRKFCNHECQGKYLSEKADESAARSGEKLNKSTYHKRAERLKAHVKHCEYPHEQCSSTWKLEVHHRDGDYTNNEPNNLMKVCKSHHVLLQNELHEQERVESLVNAGEPIEEEPVF